MNPKPIQLDIQFAYTDDAITPTYANAALATVSPDGSFVINFGFVDPLLIHRAQTQILESSQAHDQEKETNKLDNIPLRVTAKSVSRIALSQELAKHLLVQIQRVVEVMANVNINQENENATRNP